MAEPLADQVRQKIDPAVELYHGLLMVAAPAGPGKTSALHDGHGRTGAPPININFEISRRRLDLTSVSVRFSSPGSPEPH